MVALCYSHTVPDVFVRAYEDRSLCFLLGAFASSASGLPIATQLTGSILNQLLKQARPQLGGREYQEMVDLLSDKVVESLRLEAILGAIESEDLSQHLPGENLYIAGVAHSIQNLGVPHPLHRLLHEGLYTGRIPAVFTTNWDCLIEEAGTGLPESSVAWDEKTFSPHVGRNHKRGLPGLLGKLHGTADRTSDDSTVRERKARSLVHDLRGLGGPLAPDAREVLELHLRQYPLLVLGYGGYDPDIHVSLREARGPICWVVHPDETRGRDDGERVSRYLPHAASDSVFVFDLPPVLQQMFELEFVPQPRVPEFSNVFADIEPSHALVAIGLSLEHAGHGHAATRVLEIASTLPGGKHDLAVQYHRWSHHSAMYGGVLSIRRLRKLLSETHEPSDPARYYELVHYCELAIENCLRGSMLRLFNAWIGRPLAARFLRKYVDFDRLSAHVKDARLNASPQKYARMVAAFVNLTLSSVRVWTTEPVDQKRDRLEHCLEHACDSRAFALQGNVLRYLGRLTGLMDDPSLAEDYYARAEERFEVISDIGGIAEVAKYRFKTALASGTADASDHEELAEQYMNSRGIRLPYVRLVVWASKFQRGLPLIGPILAKNVLRLLRRHLGSPAGF